MKYALLNPGWSFAGSIYFGCREPHLPLEFGYARELLLREGHEVLLLDAQLFDLTLEEVRRKVEAFRPDFSVITTAPTYLFWRCAPPELAVPQRWLRALRGVGGTLVAVGPHASTTPRATLRKLGADVVILGECEDLLPQLAREPWRDIPSIAYRENGEIRVQGTPHAVDMNALPALLWSGEWLSRHWHHHHRFEAKPLAPGAEVEASRGCPYRCTFCAKENFRNQFRKRPLSTVLAEIDHLIGQGVEYVYFIDEIFLPDRALLTALVDRPIKFGVQLRIDLFTPEQLDLLGAAGCVSIEAGVESISAEGRAFLDKKCRKSTEELSALLIHAKKSVPFVQANLLDASTDDPEEVEAWRQHLQKHGVWANQPVPLFPYPGSPDYTRLWGALDDEAWERAHRYYLSRYTGFSDIQEEKPLPLSELELSPSW